MNYLVTDIEFDFTDSQGELEVWEQQQIIQTFIGIAKITAYMVRNQQKNQHVVFKKWCRVECRVGRPYIFA